MSGNLLRYGLVSSRDNVLWKPLCRESRYLDDAIRDAEIEADLHESSEADEWLAVFDYEARHTVWKREPCGGGE